MKSWLQLVRVPNLLTVPGDPLAGYLLAAAGTAVVAPPLFMVMGGSIALYAFGLVLNDLVDIRTDRAERPSRPLPGGAVHPVAAGFLAVLLAAAGLGLCALAGHRTFWFGVALMVAIVIYNGGLKKIRVAGEVNMGLCRGLNLLLGASLAGSFSSLVIPAAVFSTIYITGVTSLARAETANPAIPPLIGRLIRGLILIQALFCAISGNGAAGWISALVLALALWPSSRILGRKFYAS